MTPENKVILILCVTAVQLACAWKIARAPTVRARHAAVMVGVALAGALILAVAKEVWP